VKDYYASFSAISAEATTDPTTEPSTTDDERPSTIPSTKFFSIFNKK
jgi:hypothetical protein